MIVEVAIVAWPTCYERIAYLCESIDALKSKLICSSEIIWSCSAESTPQGKLWFGEELEQVCSIGNLNLNWRIGPPDLGSNLNDILKRSDADYLLLCQEDRLLTKELDLDESIDLLESYPKIAAVWYDWLPPGDAYWGLIGEFRLISPISLWVLADREILIRRSFPDRYGKWLEGKIIGIAETDMNQRAKRLGMIVTHPKDVYFEHRGIVSAAPRRTVEGISDCRSWRSRVA